MTTSHWIPTMSFQLQRSRVLKRNKARAKSYGKARQIRQEKIRALAATHTREQIADELKVSERTIQLDMAAASPPIECLPPPRQPRRRAGDPKEVSKLMRAWAPA